jgi:hypothetical protein
MGACVSLHNRLVKNLDQIPMQDALLGAGMLPAELPPCFTSEDLAKKVSASTLKSLPNDCGARPAIFDSPQRSLGRRVLHVVNPVPFSKLAILIAENAKKLGAHIDQPHNLSFRPIVDKFGVLNKGDLFGSSREKLKRIEGARHFLILDFSKFYYSFYTHSIEWALSGKDAAKLKRKEKGPPSLGGRIDHAARKLNVDESIGLPVGPLTSRIVAELVSSEVDRQISDSLGARLLGGYRVIDDHVLGFFEYADAEKALGISAKIARQFNIELNNLKTRIVSDDFRILEHWILAVDEIIRGFFDRKPTPDRAIRAFEKAFDLYAASHSEIVLKYFLSSLLRRVDPKTSNIKYTMARLIFRSVNISANCISVAIPWLCQIEDISESSALGKLSIAFMSKFIDLHVSLQHDGEVCWALYFINRFGLNLDVRILRDLASMRSPQCKIMVLDAAKKRNLKDFDDDIFERVIPNTKEMDWMLLYECAYGHGFRIKEERRKNLIDLINDSDMKLLLKNDVSFFKRDRISNVFATVKHPKAPPTLKRNSRPDDPSDEISYSLY